jgi:hypothetical protein
VVGIEGLADDGVLDAETVEGVGVVVTVAVVGVTGGVDGVPRPAAVSAAGVNNERPEADGNRPSEPVRACVGGVE